MVASYIKALLPSGNPRWNAGKALGTATTVTYSFLKSVPGYYSSGSSERNGFQALTASQRTGVRNALAKWSEVANITFKEVPHFKLGTFESVGKMTFAAAKLPSNVGAWAYYPGGNKGGDTWFNTSSSANSNLSFGTKGFQRTLHEIGHAIGLEHSHDGTKLPSSTDSYQYTVMSYNRHPVMKNAYPVTPMLYDIATAQYLYGTNWSHNSGNNTYKWGNNATFVEAIWDGGGIDTIDASNQTRRAIINLNEGGYSSIGSYQGGNATNNLAIAFKAKIENAKGGSGNDVIYGNALNNSIHGNAGNDIIYGGAGNDRLEGGSGNDRIYGQSGNDFIDGGFGLDYMDGGSGIDTLDVRFWNSTYELNMVTGKTNFAGETAINFENVYTGNGNDKITGTAGNNLISTAGGNDTIYGGA
ncbi:hypothetical protein C7271_22045, partial [filamentous cyanobacterium CCP5]